MALADALRFLVRLDDDPERNWLTPERHRASMEVVYRDMGEQGDTIAAAADSAGEALTAALTAAEAAEGVQQALVLYLPLAGGTLEGDVRLGPDVDSAVIVTDAGKNSLRVNLGRTVSTLVRSILMGWDGGILEGARLSTGVSIRPGQSGFATTLENTVPTPGDTYSGPWDKDRVYTVLTAGATLDGVPIDPYTSFLPTRDDHVVTGPGLKLRRNFTRFVRNRVVEVGSLAEADSNGVAVGSFALGWDRGTVAVGADAWAQDVNSTAVGYGAWAKVKDAIAIGAGAVADSDDIAQVGKPGVAQRIRVGSNDVMNVADLKAVANSATDFADFVTKINQL